MIPFILIWLFYFTVFSNYPLWNATLLVLVLLCVFTESSKNTISRCCCLVFFWCIKINNTGSMPPKNGDDVRTCGILSWKNYFYLNVIKCISSFCYWTEINEPLPGSLSYVKIKEQFSCVIFWSLNSFIFYVQII